MVPGVGCESSVQTVGGGHSGIVSGVTVQTGGWGPLSAQCTPLGHTTTFRDE